MPVSVSFTGWDGGWADEAVPALQATVPDVLTRLRTLKSDCDAVTCEVRTTGRFVVTQSCRGGVDVDGALRAVKVASAWLPRAGLWSQSSGGSELWKVRGMVTRMECKKEYVDVSPVSLPRLFAFLKGSFFDPHVSDAVVVCWDNLPFGLRCVCMALESQGCLELRIVVTLDPHVMQHTLLASEVQTLFQRWEASVLEVYY